MILQYKPSQLKHNDNMSSQRPRYGTPRGRRRPAHSSTPAPTHRLLQDMLVGMANLVSGNRPSVSARPPATVTPEKCEGEMTAAAFRSWKRSMESWITLNGWPDEVATLHIRLNCVPSLQCAIDARFPCNEWEQLTAKEALDAIAGLVLQSANQAVTWESFFTSKQTAGEPMKTFFQRCASEAIECEFKCPQCDHDLAEYMLLRKLMVGLRDPVLKRDVFQTCEDITSVEKLRNKCVSYEGAVRDAEARERHAATAAAASGSGCGRGERAVVVSESEAICEEEEVVARATFKPRKSIPPRDLCGNCGGKHAPGKAKCPARNAACLACSKVGHFQRCCRSKTTTVSGAVVCAAAGLTRHPTLQVKVTCPAGATSACVTAVADTGAMVCVAGPGLLQALQVPRNALQPVSGLRDVADKHLRCMGATVCSFGAGGKATSQPVYIVNSAKILYLSFDVCKGLGLLPQDFPHQAVAASAMNEETITGSEQPGGTPTGDGIPATPSTIPFAPLEENVCKLEEWLIRHFSSSTFNTAKSPLPVMAGPPHHIHLLPDARPHACHVPASVPKHWENEVKAQLEEDVKRGVVEPVPTGEPTQWCARMVVVGKKNGQPRRTVDYQRLNASCQRETHHTQAPFDMVSSVPPHTYKTVADAFWGFHQVELDADSRKLTTFITPWGRYRYCRTPMGHCSASDAYTRRFDEAIRDIPRKFKCVDDTLLYASSVEEAFWHTYTFLETCARAGITLKPEKFAFCRRETDFIGFHLDWESYHPTVERLSAIKGFSMPPHPSIKDIRSWFGLVNQLAPFLATAPLMEPFRELLKKPVGKKVYWDEQLQLRFCQAQDAICKVARDGLVYYDKSRPTAAVTDWSRDGIGFVVLQQHCSCNTAETPFCCKGGWKLALCGSRHLTSAEAGYAAVEGETLAIVWCLRKARLFLLGCPNLLIVTDHRPLVGLLKDRALGDITNPRLFRLKEKTLQYRFTIKYLPGKTNSAADALSRFPCIKSRPDAEDLRQEEELQVAMCSATLASLSLDDNITLDEDDVKEAAGKDPVYQILLRKVESNDWCAHKAQESLCMRPFYTVRDRLAVVEDLVTYTFDQGCVRLVVPEPLRYKVAAHLHAGHQGLDSMLRRARQSVYWPGMEGDLQHHRSQCTCCDKHAPSLPPESLALTPPPEYPFQSVVADMFQLNGHTYLAYADRLTGWLETAHFPGDATSSKIISHLRVFFRRWGAPECLSTDGGTNLASSEVTEFLKKWRVTARVSSAHYPQSNGRAEAAVKAAKRVLRGNTGVGGSLDCDKVAQALLQYLNTPLREVNKSPAQLATGRQLRDGVPIARQYYKVDQHWKHSLRDREVLMALSHARLPVARGEVPRQLPALAVGDRVLVQDASTRAWDRSGVIVEARPHKQYAVRLSGSGRISYRNRRHLKLNATLTKPTQETREAPSPAPQTPTKPARQRREPTWLKDYVQ